MTPQERAHNVTANPTVILGGLAAAVLIIHGLTLGRYGYFIDELYYLACAEHLSFGYVDHPPLSILVLAAVRSAFGSSLAVIRLVPALAGAGTVVVTGLMARELGGGRFAQGLAALTVLIAPAYLAMSGFYSMNAFDVLFWAVCAYILIRVLKTNRAELWLVFGAVAGLGLQNKISIGFLGFGVVVGLLLTRERRWFLNRWLWLGGGLAMLIFLPHVLWQIQNDWPTAEFLQNAKQFKIQPKSPAEFLSAQVLYIHPLNIPIVLIGLGWLLFAKDARPFRVVGLAFLAVVVLLMVQSSKAYYLTPAYPMLLAAGALAIERVVEPRDWRWAKRLLVGALVAGGGLLAPFALPILPPDLFLRYQSALGIEVPAEERGHNTALPQHFADRFGWQELTGTVARLYKHLPAGEQIECVILCGNYGAAGAIDLFGPAFGLPKASSPHNSYYLWSKPTRSGKTTIAIGFSKNDLDAWFGDVRKVEITASNPYGRAANRSVVYVCRDPKMPLEQAWPHAKRFI